jgi:hypothetical protein
VKSVADGQYQDQKTSMMMCLWAVEAIKISGLVNNEGGVALPEKIRKAPMLRLV